MLEFLRSSAKNSILVKILLGLLMASFGIWGVGDFMGGSSLAPGVAVKVGESEVRTDVVQRQYRREMDRFREAMNNQSVPDDLIKKSVMNTLMQDLTKTAVINAASKDMGMTVTHEQLRDRIMSIPAFQVNGKFDQVRFIDALSRMELTEANALQMMENELRQGTLLQPVVVNAVAPKTLVDALFKYRSETRIADTLLIPTSAVPVQKTPTDDELKAVYDKNIAVFTAPEYRKLTVLTLASSDLVKPESVDEAEIKTYYDQNASRYRSPETRQVVQLVFDTKEEAEKVRAQAKPDENLNALAARVSSRQAVDLGQLARDSALAKTLGPTLFDMPVHEISQPLQSPLGWHLVETTSATPESVRTFESVKEDIRKNIAADKSADAVYDASVQLEDALASGTPAAEVARIVGARVTQIEAIDQEGKDVRGLEVPIDIDPKFFVTTAFATPAGKDSKLMDLPARDGYYIIHVDQVTPPTPKPLADVRANVVAMWQDEQRAIEARVVADKLAAGITSSTSLASVPAQDKRVSYAPLGPVTRFGEGIERQHVIDAKRVSPEVLEQLFKAKAGEVFVAPVQDGVVIARLKEIIPATPTGSLAVTQVELYQSVRNDIGSNLMDAFSKGLAARYPVTVDQKIIDGVMASR